MAGTTARGYPYPTGGDPANVDGDIQALAAAIDADVTGLGTWTTYTPTWTAVTTNPVIGNGTLTGRYKVNGKTVQVQISMLAGTTTTFGSGAWIFALPTGTAVHQVAFTALVDDSSAATRWGGAGWVQTGGNSVIRTTVTDNSTGIASSTPMTWATGDHLVLTGFYELP
jgi:hypothetical protein